MANYRVEFTAEDVKWPAYVSTVTLEGDKLKKAEQVLDEGLVTLETYGGPRFIISNVKSAKRTAIFLYEIDCVLFDTKDEMRWCNAKILYEPWMKANSVAAASFKFCNDKGVCDGTEEKFIIKRKKIIKYYKNSEMIYAEQQKAIIEPNDIDNEKLNTKSARITDV